LELMALMKRRYWSQSTTDLHRIDSIPARPDTLSSPQTRRQRSLFVVPAPQ